MTSDQEFKPIGLVIVGDIVHCQDGQRVEVSKVSRAGESYRIEHDGTPSFSIVQSDMAVAVEPRP